jgi:hypothetical protein
VTRVYDRVTGGNGHKSRRLAVGVLSDRYRHLVPRPLALAGALVLMGLSQVALDAAWLQVDNPARPWCATRGLALCVVQIST